MQCEASRAPLAGANKRSGNDAMRPPFAFPQGWAEMRRLLARAAPEGAPPFAAPPFAHPSALRPNASPAFSVNRPQSMNANADPVELRKFGDIAARWWDPQGPMRPLHEINPARLGCIDGLASLAGKRAIDVGCGAGLLAESMAARGAQVTGIDLAGKTLAVARLHALETGARVA